MTGAELRQRRQQFGPSLAALSQRLGVSKNTVARWERGERRIEHAEMPRLAMERLDLQERGDGGRCLVGHP